MAEDLGPGTTDHQIQVVVGSGRRGALEPRTARLRVPRADRSAVTVFYRKKNNGKTGYNQGTLIPLKLACWNLIGHLGT